MIVCIHKFKQGKEESFVINGSLLPPFLTTSLKKFKWNSVLNVIEAVVKLVVGLQVTDSPSETHHEAISLLVYTISSWMMRYITKSE